jgi:hypothetical protein
MFTVIAYFTSPASDKGQVAAEATTNTMGEYGLEVQPGTYLLSAPAIGPERTVTLLPGAIVRQDFTPPSQCG